MPELLPSHLRPSVEVKMVLEAGELQCFEHFEGIGLVL